MYTFVQGGEEYMMIIKRFSDGKNIGYIEKNEDKYIAYISLHQPFQKNGVLIYPITKQEFKKLPQMIKIRVDEYKIISHEL